MSTNKSSSSAGASWKEKYLAGLEQQEKQERQFKIMLGLLHQVSLRLSMIAEGADNNLDKQLNGMRGILKSGDVSSQALNTIVEALSGQVKRMDAIKTERGKQVAKAFSALLGQLKSLNPSNDDKKALKNFQKSAKSRSSKLPQHSILLKEFAELQSKIISGVNGPTRPSLWQRIVAGASSSKTEPSNTVEGIAATDNIMPTSTNADSDIEEIKSEPSLALADEENEFVPDLPHVIVDRTEPPEPGFSKINQSVCEILTELLQQIEPPEMAKANYEKATQQMAKGLNWYELVATLEQVSIVVVSAFDRDQQAIELFLKQLNDRLATAYDCINSSQQAEGDSQQAQQLMQESMREQVAAMQQSVASANDLEQLKLEVSSRLDKVLSAMNKHQSSAQQRGQNLSSQLNALVEQVKNMENETQQAEQKIEQQRQRALRDVLTQLPNREGYQLRLAQETERWRRYQRPLTMVVCDIDHFKRINDNYGHQAGDKVLRIIARSLASRLRKTDFIARYGGEEFVVLMPETNQAAAKKVIENIRQAIASCPFHFKESPVSITLSFGISPFQDGDLAESVFARADKALYQAKEQGRNRVVLAGQ